MNDTLATLLGIDFGLSQVGFALARGGIAGPLGSCATNNAVENVQEIIRKEQPEMIVIGLPTGSLQKDIKAFGEDLKKLTGLKVAFIDELNTTEKAAITVSEHTYPGADDHSLAAKFILEHFLESHHQI